MKKIYRLSLLFFLMMPSACTLVATISEDKILQNTKQNKGSSIPKELCTAVEELNVDKLRTILTSLGPLCKGNKAVLILELFKVRNKVEASKRVEHFLLTRVKYGLKPLSKQSLLDFLALIGGTVGAATAMFNPKWSWTKSSLVGAASFGVILYALYNEYLCKKEREQKIDKLEKEVAESNDKLELINSMIVMLENHPES